VSTQQAERFLDAVQTEPTLRAAFEAGDVRESGPSLVAFARAHGFEFTIEEFHAQVAVAEAELTGELLDNVAGGSDDGQLANLDLQNNLQKQQQMLQMLGPVSKMLRDTGMATTRKIGG
jgi:predicted ribosomally synthesized peptide with nif11-like leader